jgi:phytoene/squalene synthetase
VGRLVLQVFGALDDRTAALSDQVCTALQLLEHWQDVAEDRRAGRVYLPLDDLAAYGVVPSDLDAPRSTPALRELMVHELRRAADLLSSGAALVPLLHGWARLAVAGYVAGGRATVRALSGHDVLVSTPTPRKADVVRELPRLLVGRP